MEIIKGRVYHNGKKGRYYQERKVLEFGDFTEWVGQMDINCLKYKVVSGHGEGRIDKMTIKAFKRWAKKQKKGS